MKSPCTGLSAILVLIWNSASSFDFEIKIGGVEWMGEVQFNTRFIDAKDYSLTSFVPVSLAQCIEECGTRGACAGAEYTYSTKLCMLYPTRLMPNSSSEMFQRIKAPGFHTISLDREQKPLLCMSQWCSIQEMCDVTAKQCIAKECKRVHSTDKSNKHTVMGNINSVGGKIIIEDPSGRSTLVCSENGTWESLSESSTPNNSNTNRCVHPKHSNGTYFAIGSKIIFTDDGKMVYLECAGSGRWIQVTKRQPGASSSKSSRDSTCRDLYNNNPNLQSGFHQVLDAEPLYCDFHTDGGNWTVFQKRTDGSTDFLRTWTEYESGFGNYHTNFWLGLGRLSHLLNLSPSQFELRIDLEDWDGNKAYALYGGFQLGGGNYDYAVKYNTYTGTAGDGFGYSNANTTKFSTKDHDNDNDQNNNCAHILESAWWFDGCYASNLNGPYTEKWDSTVSALGLIWIPWKGDTYSLKRTSMMIRETGP